VLEIVMKILLCKDVKNVGWVGDVVEVSDGYARNFLLPGRLGIVPTKGNLKSLAKAKAERVEQLKTVRERAEQAAAAVDGAEMVITTKANEQGHLFGSVGPSDITAGLREQGFEIMDEMVRLNEHIKEVGTHEVNLVFKKPADGGSIADLTAKIKVVVAAEGAEPGEQEGDVEKEEQQDSAEPQQDNPEAS
jgi:large subunit ribosomal protein L9